MPKVRIYQQWAGRPQGIKENPNWCISQVHQGRSFVFYQCSRKRGHGPDGLYCKQHLAKLERTAHGHQVSVDEMHRRLDK